MERRKGVFCFVAEVRWGGVFLGCGAGGGGGGGEGGGGGGGGWGGGGGGGGGKGGGGGRLLPRFGRMGFLGVGVGSRGGIRGARYLVLVVWGLGLREGEG